MRPLPAERFELAKWKDCGVNVDYHAVVDHNYYSVPYQLTEKRVEARVTENVAELFFQLRRVASHLRRRGRGRFPTDIAHMPQAHRYHAEWSPRA